MLPPRQPQTNPLDGRLLTTLQGWSTSQLAVLATLLCGAVFAVDLATPLGVAAGVPYLVPVILGLGTRDGRFAFGVAGAASGLIVLGLVLAPAGGGPSAYVLANRGLALFAVWVTALGVCSKITVEQRLADAHEELRARESLARLGELSALVAHEVKNPLAGIMGVLQVLEARDRPEAERRVLADVRERLSALSTTVDDLTAFARPRQLQTRSTDLLVLLEETRALVAADAHWPDLELDLVGDSLTATVDPNVLGRALLNVLLNAAAARPDGRVTARLVQRGELAVIEVADQGPGVPEHLRERIWEPFVTTRTQGTGLGLPLVRQALTSHGGRAEMSWPPEGGTTVTLALPLQAG